MDGDMGRRCVPSREERIDVAARLLDAASGAGGGAQGTMGALCRAVGMDGDAASGTGACHALLSRLADLIEPDLGAPGQKRKALAPTGIGDEDLARCWCAISLSLPDSEEMCEGYGGIPAVSDMDRFLWVVRQSFAFPDGGTVGAYGYCDSCRAGAATCLYSHYAPADGDAGREPGDATVPTQGMRIVVADRLRDMARDAKPSDCVASLCAAVGIGGDGERPVTCVPDAEPQARFSLLTRLAALVEPRREVAEPRRRLAPSDLGDWAMALCWAAVCESMPSAGDVCRQARCGVTESQVREFVRMMDATLTDEFAEVLP